MISFDSCRRHAANRCYVWRSAQFAAHATLSATVEETGDAQSVINSEARNLARRRAKGNWKRLLAKRGMKSTFSKKRATLSRAGSGTALAYPFATGWRMSLSTLRLNQNIFSLNGAIGSLYTSAYVLAGPTGDGIPSLPNAGAAN